MNLNQPACPIHPTAMVRPYRTDGPLGRRVYLQCVPGDGVPHLLSGQVTPEGADGMRVRVDVRPSLTPVADLVDSEAPLPFGLTQAELVVLRAAAVGLTVPQTARQLHKGTETVKTQRNKIILKIGARNMTHAVCIATEQGLVSAGAAAA
jgi:DNA-binding CsgD family transcriptional regulator